MFWIYFVAAIELLLCYIIWKSTLVRNQDEDWHRVPIPRWQVILSVIILCIPLLNWFIIINWAINVVREDDYKYQMWKYSKISDWFNKPMFK